MLDLKQQYRRVELHVSVELDLELYDPITEKLNKRLGTRKWEWLGAEGYLLNSPCQLTLVGLWVLTEATFSALADEQRNNFVS